MLNERHPPTDIERATRDADQMAFEAALDYLFTGVPAMRRPGRHSVTAGNRHCWEPWCEVCKAESSAGGSRMSADNYASKPAAESETATKAMTFNSSSLQLESPAEGLGETRTEERGAA